MTAAVLFRYFFNEFSTFINIGLKELKVFNILKYTQHLRVKKSVPKNGFVKAFLKFSSI